MTVVYDGNDEVLGGYLLRSTEGFADPGAYEAGEQDHALGQTGPENPVLVDPGIRLFDATNEFHFTPQDDETHHSALYVLRVSSKFFKEHFPSMLAGERDYCARK